MPDIVYFHQLQPGDHFISGCAPGLCRVVPAGECSHQPHANFVMVDTGRGGCCAPMALVLPVDPAVPLPLVDPPAIPDRAERPAVPFRCDSIVPCAAYLALAYRIMVCQLAGHLCRHTFTGRRRPGRAGR